MFRLERNHWSLEDESPHLASVEFVFPVVPKNCHEATENWLVELVTIPYFIHEVHGILDCFDVRGPHVGQKHV